MELGSKRHRLDHNGSSSGVVIEDDNLQQSAGTIRTDHQIPTLARYHSSRTKDRVQVVYVVRWAEDDIGGMAARALAFALACQDHAHSRGRGGFAYMLQR